MGFEGLVTEGGESLLSEQGWTRVTETSTPEGESGGGGGRQSARMGDQISHGGVIVVGSPNVLVNSPQKARLTDMVICEIHDEQTIVGGCETVLVNGLPAARVDDPISCGATIVTGSPNVFIQG